MEPLFRMTRRVAFSETDAAGIAHFARYFAWMEDCEHAFLRALGTSVHVSDADGQRLFPRVAASASYTAPLAFEDRFEIRLFLDQRRAKVLVWRFEFVREGETEPCATGSTTVVFARRGPEGMRSAPLPDDLVAALTATGPAVDRCAGPPDGAP